MVFDSLTYAGIFAAIISLLFIIFAAKGNRNIRFKG